MTRLHEGISVQDIRIDNKKIADELAVGRASGFVNRTLKPFLSGAYTTSIGYLYILLK
ncbi:serine ammonia-lyase [Bacillus thuringiensis serovar wratislaviensis]|nr:serine ammonia-lyase [Bacillus thuringiensis serovar wratislaviensis]OUB59179.1 serine ammonia-lyase [Bacillus thuringiensis serovar sylvestriensis]